MSIGRRLDKLEATCRPRGPVIERWYSLDEVTYENDEGERLTRAELDARPCDLRRMYIGIDVQQMREAETP